MEKSVNKIPYDDVPISRSRSEGESYRSWPTSPREQKLYRPVRKETHVSTPQRTTTQVHKNHVFGILFALLLICNVVLCGVCIQALTQQNFSKIIEENNTINVHPDGTDNISAITTKALFSVVAISAGTDTHGNTGATYANFFNTQGGSGVIIEHQKDMGNAYILTNYHVVATSDLRTYHESIYILLYGSMVPVKATVVGGSKDEDVAVLKIQNAQEYKQSLAAPVVVGNSALAAVGDTCLIVGNAEKKGVTPAEGIITNTNETYLDSQTSKTMYLLRTDAAVNEGNSGGGLFNAKGEWIGLVKAKVKSSSVDNFGYSIPANRAFSIAQNIIRNNGKLYKSVLGVTLFHSGSQAVIDAQTGKPYVYYEVKVQQADYTAQNYGFKQDDVITKVQILGEEYAIHHIADWEAAMYKTQTGSVVTVTVQRNVNGILKNVQFTFSIEIHQGVG